MVREVLSPFARRLALALPLALPACAQTMTTPPRLTSPGAAAAQPLTGQTEDAATPRNQCNATPAKGAIGQQATRELLAQARALAGARLLRVVGPDEMVTQEYNASRLTVLLDERGVVAEVRCG